MSIKHAEYSTERCWLPRILIHANPLCEAMLQSDNVFLHSHTAPLISSAIKEEQISIPSKVEFFGERENKQTNKETKQKNLPLTFDIAAGIAITVLCKRWLCLLCSQMFIILWKACINSYFLRITSFPKKTRQYSHRLHVSLFMWSPALMHKWILSQF